MIIKPESLLEALAAFAITLALGGLSVIAANQYGKRMYHKGQTDSTVV